MFTGNNYIRDVTFQGDQGKYDTAREWLETATSISSSVTSVSSVAAKAISNTPKIPKNTGVPFKGMGSSQVGVDPNTLTLNPNFTPHPGKYASALAKIKSGGMYGAVEVTRNGLVINGQHRTLIGRMLGIAVDVTIR